MSAWPTLTRNVCYPYTESYDPNRDLKSQHEGGYVATRFRYTRNRLTIGFRLVGLDSTDYATLSSFIKEQGATGSFTFTSPVSSETLTVRFSKIPVLERKGLFFSTTIELVEV